MTEPEETVLNKERHTKYWRRCFTSFLPTPYTSSDSTRLMWACFMISALDVLSSPLSPEERSSVRTWVLGLQHPEGGFCGSPSHSFDGQDGFKGEANLAATYFALIALATAADGEDEAQAAFSGVNRSKTLDWLKKLQREDGSFGQLLWEGEPVGGSDTRHSYLVSGIRWMLRGHPTETAENDINVEAMIGHIRRGQTYDGGVAEFSQHESHAGYAYCAVAALDLLDRPSSISEPYTSTKAMDEGIADRQGLLKFLAGRPFAYLADEEDEDEGEAENFVDTQLENLDKGCRHVGFNGRWNKKADTCYTWWTVGTLAMLKDPYPVSIESSKRYLLEVTQHRIGGFGKVGGAPPDMFHAYLGLASLAVLGDDTLKDFDVSLVCSKETTRKIEIARAGLLASTEEGNPNVWANDGFWTS